MTKENHNAFAKPCYDRKPSTESGQPIRRRSPLKISVANIPQKTNQHKRSAIEIESNPLNNSEQP
jgi:hypothetical protein